MLLLIYAGGYLLGSEVVLKSDAPAGGHKIAASGSYAAQTEDSIAGGDDLESIDLGDVAVLVGGENALGHEGFEDGVEWGATSEAVVDNAGVAEGVVGNWHGDKVTERC